MCHKLSDIENRIASCSLCGLCESRTNTVPGTGNHSARIMIIGEGPGAQEDAEGKPFVGAAGKLLTDMLDAVGISREEVYIANIVKCRPPKNRVPAPDEANACLPYLMEQISVVDPDIILLLGATALKYYLSADLRITKDRGKWFTKDDRWVLATFHPAALLRDPSKKPLSFEDLVTLKRKLNEII